MLRSERRMRAGRNMLRSQQRTSRPAVLVMSLCQCAIPTSAPSTTLAKPLLRTDSWRPNWMPLRFSRSIESWANMSAVRLKRKLNCQQQIRGGTLPFSSWKEIPSWMSFSLQCKGTIAMNKQRGTRAVRVNSGSSESRTLRNGGEYRLRRVIRWRVQAAASHMVVSAGCGESYGGECRLRRVIRWRVQATAGHCTHRFTLHRRVWNWYSVCLRNSPMGLATTPGNSVSYIQQALHGVRVWKRGGLGLLISKAVCPASIFSPSPQCSMEARKAVSKDMHQVQCVTARAGAHMQTQT